MAKRKVGRCLKWSKGRTRCMRRKPAGGAARVRSHAQPRARAARTPKKEKCLKWSKGRKRCILRASPKHGAREGAVRPTGFHRYI